MAASSASSSRAIAACARTIARTAHMPSWWCCCPMASSSRPRASRSASTCCAMRCAASTSTSWLPPRGRPAERCRSLLTAERGDHLGRRLHQLDQHALAAERELLVALGVDEADVMPRSAAADAPGRKTQALRLQPLHRGRQVVHPQADVVQWRRMHGRLLLRVQRLHQVHLHRVGALPQRADVLVDVLALALEGAGDRHAQQVHPQVAQLGFVEAADGDLLQAEDLEGTLTHHANLKMG
mmetsp:Transcript_6792/g.28657  ORF Transcript_6792/g.28657 Transcript_6792/m.28657 type:complete len:240 (+) Transcript_6792:209-928(+)